MKKSRVYTRKRLALHWILLALVFLLVVHQLLGVCLVVPARPAHGRGDVGGGGRPPPPKKGGKGPFFFPPPPPHNPLLKGPRGGGQTSLF